MHQLYPIIRRKRRPLIQENPETLKADVPPVMVVPVAEPVKADVEPVKITQPKKIA